MSCHGHPRANQGGYVREHILVVERALGWPLPLGAEVHHTNGDTGDNRPENLVVCESHSYHALLHQRLRALRACGNAGWRKCKYCKHYDDPAKLCIYGASAVHRECVNRYNRHRDRARKGG